MGSYDNPNVDETVRTAWEDAETACFNYLCKVASLRAGVDAFIGDAPDESRKVNIVAFMISGGREQTQNYQCPRPNKAFMADAALAGIFETRKQALDVGGAILNGLPAYETDEDDAEAVPRRGLEPNVSAFESTFFPECFSVKEEGKKRVWILSMTFRVTFNDDEQ